MKATTIAAPMSEGARLTAEGFKPLTAADYAAAAKVLRNATRFFVCSHVDPDGDTLGSAIALHVQLLAAGKESVLLNPSAFPWRYRRLERFATTSLKPPTGFMPDVIVMIDSSAPERIEGPFRRADYPNATVVNIDHHRDNPHYGTVNLVDVTQASSASVTFELMKATGWPITAASAEGLFIGLTTDTGRFAFSNTDARVLRTASELAELGVAIADVTDEIYFRNSYGHLHNLGHCLDSLELHHGGRVSSMALSHAQAVGNGTTVADVEGIVDYGLHADLVRATCLVREVGPGQCKVSLRSQGEVNVQQVAKRYGGGGHKNAAGCTIQGTVAEIRAAIVRQLDEVVTQAEAHERA